LITYVDASVLLRVVLAEPDPLPSWRDINPVASDLIRVEALRVMDRLRLMYADAEEALAETRAELIDALARFDLAPISPGVLTRAGDPFPTSLGTLDAIHLATALAIRESHADLAFATHDQELAIAAKSMGFPVVGA
jgi:predicted nucleic acid-binding protein